MTTRNWTTIKEYEDIKFEFFEGIAKITINRPEVYNAFRPQTNFDMLDAMDICRERSDIGVIVFTGTGEITLLGVSPSTYTGDFYITGDGKIEFSGSAGRDFIIERVGDGSITLSGSTDLFIDKLNYLYSSISRFTP